MAQYLVCRVFRSLEGRAVRASCPSNNIREDATQQRPTLLLPASSC
jgi:hypothetical protein